MSNLLYAPFILNPVTVQQSSNSGTPQNNVNHPILPTTVTAYAGELSSTSSRHDSGVYSSAESASLSSAPAFSLSGPESLQEEGAVGSWAEDLAVPVAGAEGLKTKCRLEQTRIRFESPASPFGKVRSRAAYLTIKLDVLFSVHEYVLLVTSSIWSQRKESCSRSQEGWLRDRTSCDYLHGTR